MPTEVLIGFLGLVIGAIIGFGGDIYINNRRMKFEAYKDIKQVLNQMHIKLVDLHSKIQKFYVVNRDNDPRKNIIDLKDFHWDVMEIYKEFRIYFGDMKAYELQSAVYNYYYEYAKNEKNQGDFTDFFFISYQALKDAYGLMISEVKLGLVSVKFLKKVDRKLELNKLEEYQKYSARLQTSLDKYLKAQVEPKSNKLDTPEDKAADVVRKRMLMFEDEYQAKIRAKKDE